MMLKMNKKPLVFAGLIGAALLAFYLLPHFHFDKKPIALQNGGFADFRPVSLPMQNIDRVINKLDERNRRWPANPQTLVRLGQAFLQKARLGGDFSLYWRAEQCFQAVLERDASNAEAQAGMAELCAQRHHFSSALAWANRAIKQNPYRARYYGLLADAQLELGRYAEAVQTIEKMIELRPDLASYSRVSHVRELHGDLEGAIEAMGLALDAGIPGKRGTEWCRVQLGHLYFLGNELERAEIQYVKAQYFLPGFAPALAGLAKLRMTQNRWQEALEYFHQAISRNPLPDYIAGQAEVYLALGDTVTARSQYELAWKLLESEREMGIRPELELAVLGGRMGYEASTVLELAQQAYQERPSLMAADALAWAWYRAGHFTEAQRYSQKALRLGSKNATFYYHAGMIARALGNRALARSYLKKALAMRSLSPQL
ncbi:MAG: hypothetical protein D6814_08505 [Calditrichaeota bacterium]|nr:MAG: hypothetical protein D6814_08505 [Calditrichota bacterium]